MLWENWWPQNEVGRPDKSVIVGNSKLIEWWRSWVCARAQGGTKIWKDKKERRAWRVVRQMSGRNPTIEDAVLIYTELDRWANERDRAGLVYQLHEVNYSYIQSCYTVLLDGKISVRSSLNRAWHSWLCFTLVPNRLQRCLCIWLMKFI
jgi:hypothetical protein